MSINKYIVDQLFDDIIDDVRCVIYEYKRDINGGQLTISYSLALGDNDKFLSIFAHNLLEHTCNTYFIMNSLIYKYIQVAPAIAIDMFSIKRCEMPDEIAKLMSIIASKL